LIVIIDLFDRKVIGWAFSRFLKAVYTTIPEWRMAIRNRPTLIHRHPADENCNLPEKYNTEISV
jgi:transposase InsO family protein